MDAVPPVEREAILAELAELDRTNAEALRALRLPIEREPAFVFRARPRDPGRRTA